jgi:hypothetical protein
VTLAIICSECGKPIPLECSGEELFRYLNGLRIEYAMPEASEDEMNLIENGVCDECLSK